jgi:hypothetical protein
VHLAIDHAERQQHCRDQQYESQPRRAARAGERGGYCGGDVGGRKRGAIGAASGQSLVGEPGGKVLREPALGSRKLVVGPGDGKEDEHHIANNETGNDYQYEASYGLEITPPSKIERGRRHD